MENQTYHPLTTLFLGCPGLLETHEFPSFKTQLGAPYSSPVLLSFCHEFTCPDYTKPSLFSDLSHPYLHPQCWYSLQNTQTISQTAKLPMLQDTFIPDGPNGGTALLSPLCTHLSSVSSYTFYCLLWTWSPRRIWNSAPLFSSCLASGSSWLFFVGSSSASQLNDGFSQDFALEFLSGLSGG